MSIATEVCSGPHDCAAAGPCGHQVRQGGRSVARGSPTASRRSATHSPRANRRRDDAGSARGRRVGLYARAGPDRPADRVPCRARDTHGRRWYLTRAHPAAIRITTGHAGGGVSGGCGVGRASDGCAHVAPRRHRRRHAPTERAAARAAPVAGVRDARPPRPAPGRCTGVADPFRIAR